MTDDATVEMSFKSEQINDLLKSMVLEDLGGGTVAAVSYASRDPITKTLGTFAVNLTDNPSIGQILGRLRGTRIEVEAATPATGTIVGVEKRTVPAGENRTLEKEFITILTAEGLRTLPLDAITRLKILDERLQRELEKALAVLALGTDNERKSVTLDFTGRGARRVRVGYGQDLAGANREFEAAADRADGRRQLAKAEMARAAAEPAAPAAGFAGAANGIGDKAVERKRQREEMSAGVASIQSVAEGAALGELFRYEIAKPVSIARQRSAMLPIVSEPVEAERVSIYDERVLAKHPLAGLRLVNSTKLNLMQGPITVYDGDSYAGDARVEDLPPGGERLVSYAVDLDVEVAPRTESRPEELVSVKLVKGTLVVTRKLARRRLFEVKNSGADAVQLLVEHPREEPWKLVGPVKPVETTRDRHRFALKAEPGKPVSLEVVEEQQIQQHLAVANVDDGTILVFTNAKQTSPAVKEALGKVIDRKREIELLAQERAKREQEVVVVGQEQERIRQNMAQLERTSDLSTRYVQKFAAQEDRVETLRKEVAELQAKEQESRRGLDDFLQTLQLD